MKIVFLFVAVLSASLSVVTSVSTRKPLASNDGISLQTDICNHNILLRTTGPVLGAESQSLSKR